MQNEWLMIADADAELLTLTLTLHSYLLVGGSP